VVAHAVLITPGDVCKEHPKHVERSCSEIKQSLLTAASRWKLIYIRLVMHGTMNVKNIQGLATKFIPVLLPKPSYPLPTRLREHQPEIPNSHEWYSVLP
jgi:hypothetical protein